MLASNGRNIFTVREDFIGTQKTLRSPRNTHVSHTREVLWANGDRHSINYHTAEIIVGNTPFISDWELVDERYPRYTHY